MKAKCPNKCKKTTFSTVVATRELWEVDRNGNFIKVLEHLGVSKPPSPDGIWFCRNCGAQAKVK
jgi:hypothetical protein